MRVLMITATALTVALVLFIVGYVLVNGIPNITWELLSTKPSYLNDRVGILPDILNTIYIVIATLIVVLPLGVGALPIYRLSGAAGVGFWRRTHVWHSEENRFLCALANQKYRCSE